uniref:Uncharacterized protein n=1 Tax=Rhizophora mucronata TaxID=61149 RepID=A0A2P2JDX7_RHIMU
MQGSSSSNILVFDSYTTSTFSILIFLRIYLVVTVL